MKETAKAYMVRLYPLHRAIIKKGAKKLKLSDAGVVRLALEGLKAALKV